METPVESELVSAAQAGDEQALTLLLQQYLPLVYNIVGRALNGETDVDDVVQEAMIRVVAGLPTLRDPDRFRSWLVSIAVRQVREHVRSRRRSWTRQASLEQVAERPDPALDFVGLTVLELGLSGQRREVAEATRWLPAEDREVLALWWQEVAGVITRAELAEALGVSNAHAAVRVQRTKQRLESAREVLRCIASRHRCPRLVAGLGRWDGRPDPRLMGRLSRHVHGCDRCAGPVHQLVPPEHLLAGIALLPVPAGLLQHLPISLPAFGHGLLPLAGAAAKTSSLLSLKPALAVGAGLAGATLAASFAVHYLPLPAGPPPPVPSPVVSAPAEPTVAAPEPVVARPPAPAATPTVAPPRGPGVATADLYVAPGGDDGADGSLGRPLASLARAVQLVRPGQTIALRGGRYRAAALVTIDTDGTAARPIVLSNYRDEHPVLDASAAPAGAYVTQHADWWVVQGLEIAGAHGSGYVCSSCSHNTFRRLSVHGNQATGLVLRDKGTAGNLVDGGDFFDNHDDDQGGADADGLALIFGTGTGNVVRGVRTYDNSDDGVGLQGFADPVTVSGSWSWGNGVNRWRLEDYGGSGGGFVLAGDRDHPVDHVVTGNAAWDNAGRGFTDGGNTGRPTLTSNTAYRNGRAGFTFGTSSPTMRGNLALANHPDSDLSAGTRQSGNSWNGRWDVSMLRGTDPFAAEGPRPANGALPKTDFLTADGIGAPMTGTG